MNIGPYKVLSELGRGGMGVVYKAENPSNARTVAIKMISGVQALDDTHRMGLVREARTVRNLRHPNIVRVFDIGQHKGWLYLVMEYLQGESLDRRIKARAAFPISEKISILIELCNGLAYAHTFGVVHRDIKPANIFLLSNGKTKILDFGLAIGRDHTNDRGIAGTIPYMSPEQFQRAELDSRSDIWSAGVTMYELLTGELPFRGKSVSEIREQVLCAQVPDLRSTVPFHTEFQRILIRALAKNTSHRYSSARFFSADLETLNSALREDIAASRFDPEDGPDSLSVQSGKSALQSTLSTTDDVDLKLRSGCASSVFVHEGKFYLIAISRRLRNLNLRTLAMLVGLYCILALPFAWVHSLTLFRLLLYLQLPLVIMWGPGFATLEIFDLLANYPRCRGCWLPMSAASRWTRFVRTNTEVALGYRDCIAALRENLWQDAAKLLSIHGTEPLSFWGNRLISGPLRYHLQFYECRTCQQQTARLTTDDLVENEWQLRTRFVDTHRGASKRRGHNVSILHEFPSRVWDAFASLRHRTTLIFDIRAMAGAAMCVMLIGFAAHYGWHIGMRGEQQTISSEALNDRWMASRCFYGFGTPRDLQLAVHYYEAAAGKGDGFSANRLGEMYEKAIGLPQSYEKALDWYIIASQDGNADAYANLGRMYERGVAVPKDLQRARYWYGLAAIAGNSDARNTLAKLPPE